MEINEIAMTIIVRCLLHKVVTPPCFILCLDHDECALFVCHTTGAKENGINKTKQNLSAWSNERKGMDSIRGSKQNQNHRRDMKTVIVKSFADDYDCDHLQSDEDINPP